MERINFDKRIIELQWAFSIAIIEGSFLWADAATVRGAVRERERVSRKKIKVREKVEKSWKTVSSNVLWLGRVEE